MSSNPDLVLDDAALFENRTERKYFLAPAQARGFVDAVSEHLEPHRFRGEGASEVPRPVHFITTLYFDTPSLEIAQACRSGRDNLKLRAREYYDEHPDLAELATSHRELVRSSRTVWLELKARDNHVTRKLRFPLPADEVTGFLAGRELTPRALELHRREWGARAEDMLDEVRRLCARVEGPLRADCLVHYRRRAWQDQTGHLRVTLDTRVAYHRPEPDLFHGFTSLRDAVAGPPVARLGSYLVELKLRGDMPGWLTATVDAAKLEPARIGERQFSKFLAASAAVHA
ncbi:VTC domain protein [Enhygromyxa salina]|uniref:VTC domain protein n=1 Tax=Enhygromyxa salina TaxID=215803 RepID=A0A2S9YLA1_9BACT|nr:VTC domain-containing protein [Enhygromyxa salina]PRQ05879.1 VTC domain protein [Enhygromyxa salina]